MEKGEPSCTVGGNVKWCSHSGKMCGGSSKELKMDLPYDPAIALLGIYPKDADAMKARDTFTPMFIAAMFTIATLWKEPWCPSKDEWIKMWFMYTMQYFSAIRNDKYPPWMELKGIMLSEISQPEDKHYMVSFIWGI